MHIRPTHIRHLIASRPGRVLIALAATVAVLGTTMNPVNAGATASSPGSQTPGCVTFPACIPKTVVLDGLRLAVTRELVRAGVPSLRQELSTLTAQADGYLTQGPWSVMDKPQLPPSGDKHDYLSQAPYWWPTQPKTASNPWGCPYIQKDGITNPDINLITDHAERGAMFNAVYTLTLAWYYTGNSAYAERAALDLRTWFIDPATRMNPSLNFTQFVPCLVSGRGIGIIDFSQQFTDIIDATAILDTGAPSWTADDHAAMQSWYSQFLTWLQTSSNGASEAAQTNNHGSFFDMQEAALALATGQPDLARTIVTTAETKRLDVQLAGDGTQPLEITRTRSWHYSIFNLLALTRLAMIGQHVGVDLWHYTTPSGGSILKSIDYLIPAATGTAAWPYPELNFQAFAAIDVLHTAADDGDQAARAAVPKTPQPPGGDLWLLIPAPEQLDPVVS
ncbi:MAG TPA: alginate lyase family protein [Actinocrinis sp.]|uniref:alginate lyase family protein n=1 Tax=Actinocrinis sp. TaxID=1920516 RepID=UPI002DDD3AA5|nr:alginate lyase family protein [Actinocrinis sp.]HEV3173806.1 alginate lyase family protein [Actinocrinis sp.]